MEKEYVYTGGGSEYSLIKINPAELVKANGAQVVNIRK
jgi:prolyl-tRNA editing enzyme YbaK/EbsC (Cys-tRNA(Pro) deacylase)